MQRVRCVAAAVLLLPAWCMAAAEPAALAWSDLRPAEVAEVNPFAQLNDAQLVALGEIVFSRTLESRGHAIGDAGRAKRDALTAQLTRDGLDVETLLKQREQLIAQRRDAAETPVAAWQGRTVRLTGYLVPASADGRGVTDYLLVPWAGACSHTPPPPMNQIVRVRAEALALPHEDAVARSGTPLTLTGTMEVRPVEQMLFFADGMVPIRSAYALQGAAVADGPAREASHPRK
jgi:hypothetical protein